MQQDDVIWEVIDGNFCSFKVKTDVNTVFCKNENNVTGMCNRQSCPLANSQYATVREIDGKVFLLTKTVERAHQPAKMWHRLELPEDLEEAHAMIEEQLKYHSPFLRNKCVIRMTKLHEYMTRVAAAEANGEDEKRVLRTRIPRKLDRREKSREARAHEVARLESVIETELLERLKSGMYNSVQQKQKDSDVIANIPARSFEKVLKSQGRTQDQEEELYEEEEEQEIEEELEEEDEEDEDLVEYQTDDDSEFDIEESEEEDIPDVEDIITKPTKSKMMIGASKQKKGGRKSGRRSVEMEEEIEGDMLAARQQQAIRALNKSVKK